MEGRVVRPGTALAVACLLAQIPTAASALQAPDLRELHQDCRSACVEIHHLRTLGSFDDPELIAPRGLPFGSASIRGSGPSFHANVPGDRVIVWDEQGRFQGSWGRRGAGPGEFLTLRGIGQFREDSVLVTRMRTSIFSSDGGWGRDLPGELLSARILPTSDGHLVAWGLQDPEQEGLALHLYDEAWSYRRRFLPYAPDPCGPWSVPVLGRSRDGQGAWAVTQR